MSEASSIRAKPHSFSISAFLAPWFTAKSLSIAIVAQVNDRESCSRPSRSERAMNAENASEPQQTVTEPAAETSPELPTEVPIVGGQQQASPEQTAESRSRGPSGGTLRPPGRSRSRSPGVALRPKLALKLGPMQERPFLWYDQTLEGAVITTLHQVGCWVYFPLRRENPPYPEQTTTYLERPALHGQRFIEAVHCSSMYTLASSVINGLQPGPLPGKGGLTGVFM